MRKAIILIIAAILLLTACSSTNDSILKLQTRTEATEDILEAQKKTESGNKQMTEQLQNNGQPDEVRNSEPAKEALKDAPFQHQSPEIRGIAGSITFTDAFMPELKGLAIEEAREALSKSGITEVAVTRKYNEYFPAGTVIEQNYPANAPVRKNFSYAVVISDGPDPSYHEEILALCQRKGWTDELQPYILSSVKFLAKIGFLLPEEIFQRLEKNVGRIYLAGKSDTIGGLNGFYNGNIVLNRYTFNDYILAHEMLHALSKHPSDDKMGLISKGYNFSIDNCTDLNEGYVDHIACRMVEWHQRGLLNIGEIGQSPILIYGNASIAYGRESILVKALEELVGSSEFQKMFFCSEKHYMDYIEKFDEKYGAGCWKYLMENTSKIIEHKAVDKTQYIKNFYDKLLECIELEFESYKDEADKISNMLNKLNTMRQLIPLDYNNYREKMDDMQTKFISRLQALQGKADEAFEFSALMPDYTNMYEDDLIRWLSAYTGAKDFVTNSTFSDTIPTGKIIRVTSAAKGVCPPGTILDENNDHFTLLVSKGIELPDGWMITPDVVWKSGTIITTDRLEESYLYKDIVRMGLEPEFEIIEAEPGYEFENAKYRVIGQYPAAGTAIKEGSKIVVKVLVNKGQK